MLALLDPEAVLLVHEDKFGRNGLFVEHRVRPDPENISGDLLEFGLELLLRELLPVNEVLPRR